MKIFIKKCILVIGILFIMVSSKVFSQINTATSSFFSTQITPQFIDSVIYEVIDYGKKFIGKPYRYQPESGVMFDCSGFIQHIYKSYNLEIPRISRSIGEFVDKIDLSAIQEGDFLFFQGRNTSSKTIGHIAVVVGCDSTDLKMMHSCRRGIVIDDFPRS